MVAEVAAGHSTAQSSPDEVDGSGDGSHASVGEAASQSQSQSQAEESDGVRSEVHASDRVASPGSPLPRGRRICCAASTRAPLCCASRAQMEARRSRIAGNKQPLSALLRWRCSTRRRVWPSAQPAKTCLPLPQRHKDMQLRPSPKHSAGLLRTLVLRLRLSLCPLLPSQKAGHVINKHPVLLQPIA